MDDAAPRGLLRVSTGLVGTTATIEVFGEIDQVSVAELDARLRRVTGIRSVLTVVVDLNGVGYLGSAGLALLRLHHHRCAADGIEFVVAAGNRAVLRPLEVSALDTLLTVRRGTPRESN